ncbi:MAG: MATE family efflux transporter [Saprospiraceae bacterium]|jgi:MATE family multidrug resistance protein|nr:MATE family efflux transporter [Saprospiraceae bacterium]MCA0332525.1 MATE family efflux transporter [Bacteroidota bacterium]MCO5276830.1 MATE family efflux transporter [Saprospiraceae bacterium]
MKLTPSVRQIIAIALPIMIGSAAQNVLQLSDSIFLYHLSETDFAAIGFVGVFYLMVNAIGYGFSKGGQIIIANMSGRQDIEGIRRNFQALGLFEAVLATVMFLFMYFISPWFFGLFLQNQDVLHACTEFIKYRSFGVFFSYIGITLIALYTGIAKTKFIMIETIFLLVVNGILNYALIFGKWGLPAMGIAGSALASTIAEAMGALVFMLYLYFDKNVKHLNIFTKFKLEFNLIKNQFKLSAPIVTQNFVSLGSWFLFFAIIEDMGERALAISNLVRIVYLILSIPTWGFSSATNTIVGNLMGQANFRPIMASMKKTALVCFGMTMIIALPIIIWPDVILYPLLGSTDMTLINDSHTTLYVLLAIIAFNSIISIYVNGIAGVGATMTGLKIQTISAIAYLFMIYLVVDVWHSTLNVAWSTEIIYWLVQMLGVIWFFSKVKFNKLTYGTE